MELGCGVRVKAIKGHDYLYVWHYERDGARRRQVYDYIGPASDSDARRRAIDSLEGHARKAIEEARHRIEAGRGPSGGAGRGAAPPQSGGKLRFGSFPLVGKARAAAPAGSR